MNIHLKTATGYIKRSPFQSISALFVLSLTFFVATFMAIIINGSNQSLKYFETRPQIISFIKNDVTNESVSALQNKLNTDTRIKDVKYVAKEEALEIYKKATEDNPLLAELVSPSIFPASLEFSVKNLSDAQSVIDEVNKEAIVDSIGFTASLGGEKSLGDVVERLKTITYYIRLIGGIFVGVLTIASFMVLLVIISMRMAVRKNEIEILSLIGATKNFVRSPIILEALIYSTLGVFIGWLSSLTIWLYITPSVFGYFREVPVIPRSPLQFFLLFVGILVFELLLGTFLALLGSIIAVKRSLKFKK